MSDRRPHSSRPRLWRRAALWAGVIVAATLGAFLVVATLWPPINEVATGVTPEYPDLRPQVLRFRPDLVLERAASAVEALDGWVLVDVQHEARRVRAERHSPVFGFVDEVTIWVEPHGSGSLVNVRSHSRLGRADFGQNARNIHAFQARLTAELELARAVR